MEQSMHINVGIPVTNIHTEQSMHINVGIPVTIIHVKENRKTEGNKIPKRFFKLEAPRSL